MNPSPKFKLFSIKLPRMICKYSVDGCPMTYLLDPPIARHTSFVLTLSFWVKALHDKTLSSWPGFHLFFQEVFLGPWIAAFTPRRAPGLNACVLYELRSSLRTLGAGTCSRRGKQRNKDFRGHQPCLCLAGWRADVAKLWLSWLGSVGKCRGSHRGALRQSPQVPTVSRCNAAIPTSCPQFAPYKMWTICTSWNHG